MVLQLLSIPLPDQNYVTGLDANDDLLSPGASGHGAAWYAARAARARRNASRDDGSSNPDADANGSGSGDGAWGSANP